MFSSNFLLGPFTFHCLCNSINSHSKLKLAEIFKFKTMGDRWLARGGGLAASYLRPDIWEIRLENHPYVSRNEREKLWPQSGCRENPGWLPWRRKKPFNRSHWIFYVLGYFSGVISLRFPFSSPSWPGSVAPTGAPQTRWSEEARTRCEILARWKYARSHMKSTH